jgi:hypothetical protein
MKLTYQSKETVEYLTKLRQFKDIEMKTSGVMTPYLADAELDEYVRERSGEVVTYKLAEVQK